MQENGVREASGGAWHGVGGWAVPVKSLEVRGQDGNTASGLGSPGVSERSWGAGVGAGA